MYKKYQGWYKKWCITCLLNNYGDFFLFKSVLSSCKSRPCPTMRIQNEELKMILNFNYDLFFKLLIIFL